MGERDGPEQAATDQVLEMRRELILGDVDLEAGRTLEIGPLASPFVTRAMADVRYVDVVDRAGLVAHYGSDPTVDTDLIPEIDHWLTRDDGTVATLAETVATDAPFHHVVASHVIEHVPDMVGWLRDVAEVLVDGGDLLLAVPDLRFSFDALRPAATVGQIVQAHLDQDRIPSYRAVYDYARTAVPFPAAPAWAGAWPPEERVNPMPRVRSLVERQQRGEYVDCHVWPLTPVRFVDVFVDLVELGLVDFAVERVTATPYGHHEFYVTLRRIPRTADRDEHVTDALARLGEIRASLPEEERTWPHQVREAQLLERQAVLERRLARAERSLAAVTGARDRARVQRDRAREQRDRARARAALLAGLLEEDRSRLGRRVRRRLRRLLPRR
ncbi:hypothetical protein CFI00_15545 [Nocardioides sp. S5]|uniref:methyltransferase domain-containing protein n=1 Tax=Nocardioides sp. S5 TaxID=2017486 RepID=UPI001A8D5900|nr:methyltransferase domain-containing protein [Nocardioides sp. S5]QSR31897.1 hypothetical protein CFI00_15545 [Nocardioides sp. S5]